VLLGAVPGHGAAALSAGFEDLALEGPGVVAYAGPGGGVYYNGSDGTGGFTSGGIDFLNAYNADWGSWSGWAYSTTGDTETAGWGNQYSSFAGGAREGEVHAVMYAPTWVDLPEGWRVPLAISVTNTSYAAISMRDGDDFARQFGPGDYFKLILTGLDATGAELAKVEAYLADFREATDPGYILDSWLDVDLSGMGSGVAKIEFALESTDVGAWGMNTPAYIAVDNLVLAQSRTWGGYVEDRDGWFDTGSFLGLIYPVGDWVYVLDLGKYLYLPESFISPGGSWAYIPNPG
jgi:hypothetical protein